MSEVKEMETEVLKGEHCAFCNNKTLTLTQGTFDVPFFGLAFVLTMECTSCHYRKSDVEFNDEQPPAKYNLDITQEADMTIRVIRSGNATIKVPYVGTIEPGDGSNGFISNVEGVLDKFKKMIETMRDTAEDKSEQKKAKNLLKKIQKCKWGQEPLKLIIEDPSGNSAIISDKAVKEKLKKNK